jgi:lipoyl(octanoyl) transferase
VTDPLERSIVRDLGLQPLSETWAAMQEFTMARAARTPDEIWHVQHPPVFTLGMRADRAHLLAPGDIPIVQLDRGGQVTYHGPGQLVVYALVDLKRRGLTVRGLVLALEGAVIDALARRGVHAVGRRDAPGVYVDGRKLASIGLRVRRNCSYHGMAVNVQMDLEPFARIHPCGYEGLEVTQVAAFDPAVTVEGFRRELEPHLLARLEGRERYFSEPVL